MLFDVLEICYSMVCWLSTCFKLAVNIFGVRVIVPKMRSIADGAR